MDNIVRNLEEIELTEAELETIYGATQGGATEGLNDVKDLDGLFCHTGTHFVNINGTSFFTSTCNDSFILNTTITVG